MTDFLQNIQFLRPWWLLAIPILLVFFYLFSRHAGAAGWNRYISRDKIEVLSVNRIHQGRWRRWWMVLPFVTACVALAGPAWKFMPDQLAGNRQAMVILFDLSPSMLATDVKPSRLVRARLKLIDLLRTRSEGETALVAYAGKAHRVAPLTDDPATIEALVPTLHPEIMPQPGNQPEEAVKLAMALFSDSDYAQGDIVLITDGMPSAAAKTIGELTGSQFRLSVLSVGTRAGAPIPVAESGFLRDAQNRIVIATVDQTLLQDLATDNQGRYATVSVDDTDISYLTALAARPFSARFIEGVPQFDKLHDAGYWLVIVLLPVVACGFRRNVLWSVCVLSLFSAVAMTPTTVMAFGWSDLWFSKDQQAARALARGDTASAARLFENKKWAAAARYQNGQYRTAAQMYADAQTADDYYNLGNARALSGDLTGALQAYDQTLALQAHHQQALINRLIVEGALKQPEQDPETEEREGNGGDSNTELQSEEQSQDTQEQASDAQHKQSGGTTGAGQTLDQQALQDQGSGSTAVPGEKTDTDDAQDATAVQQDTTISGTRLEGEEQADSSAPSVGDSQSNVLNPYSEQWLRNLPHDPGGFMRRKFHYQAQLWRAENGEQLPVVPSAEDGRF